MLDRSQMSPQPILYYMDPVDSRGPYKFSYIEGGFLNLQL